MKIYACGGTGINIAQVFETYRGKEEFGFSKLDICYIDSSNSNISKIKTSSENIYILEDSYGNVKEGGGKKRKLIYEDASIRASEILLKFKPEKINLVIHSFSGGTGSVIGPVLVSNLLEKGNAVIVLGIGSTDSKIEIDNTINTIKSYAHIPNLRNRPVPCLYYENSAEKPRGTIDKMANLNIAMLSVYFSGNNEELDYTDLYNFLNYQEVTDHKPKLSYLEFFSGDIDINKDNYLIAVATLSDYSTSTHPNHIVDYQCTGFISEDVKSKLNTKLPIHLSIIDGVFNDIIHRLENTSHAIEEKKAAALKKNISVDTRSATDEGIIL